MKARLSKMHTIIHLLPAPLECLGLGSAGLQGNQSHAHDCASLFPIAREDFSTWWGRDVRSFPNCLVFQHSFHSLNEPFKATAGGC